MTDNALASGCDARNVGRVKLAIANKTKELTKASFLLVLCNAGVPMDIDQIIITTSSLFMNNQSIGRGDCR
jgi:hypothetical protein